ncbi:MAG TPA: thiolase family protein [Nitrososphaerales archaeon]|nr:thiolase family protein [Nitrososphaerales archaeon]
MRSKEQYLADALTSVLKNCGLEKRELDGQGICVAGTGGGHGSSGERWSSEVIHDLGIGPSWLIRTDQGGSSSLVQLIQAALAIERGEVDLVLCVGGGSTIFGETDQTFYVKNFEMPFGMMGPNSLFGLILKRHMHKYGTEPGQLGKIAVTQRFHASLNPNAYLRKRITIEDYLSSAMISDPIRLLDCCIPVSGAACFLMASEERSRSITDHPIFIKGFGQCFNYQTGTPYRDEITDFGMRIAATRAFERATLRKDRVSFLQLYDDYTIAVLIQLEDMGFCAKGGGGKFLDRTDISYRGELPINTGGGMLSGGQIGGGFVHLIEAIKQLKGEAGSRQVKDPEIGLVTGMGGESYSNNLINHVAVILSNNEH